MKTPVQTILPTMNRMLQPISGFNNNARWKAADNCIFFLTIEGIISESESKKAQKRLITKCRKEGIILKEQHQSLTWK